MRTIIAAAFVLGLAGCMDEDRGGVRSADTWAVATANPLGPPTSCVEKGRIRGTAVRDDRTIDFQMDDGQLLRNRLTNACAGLIRSPRFVYRTGLERVCSTDIITLVDAQGRPSGSCGLGQFQPIAIPAQTGRPG
jgi:hypothetical protein